MYYRFTQASFDSTYDLRPRYTYTHEIRSDSDSLSYIPRPRKSKYQHYSGRLWKPRGCKAILDIDIILLALESTTQIYDAQHRLPSSLPPHGTIPSIYSNKSDEMVSQLIVFRSFCFVLPRFLWTLPPATAFVCVPHSPKELRVIFPPQPLPEETRIFRVLRHLSSNFNLDHF